MVDTSYVCDPDRFFYKDGIILENQPSKVENYDGYLAYSIENTCVEDLNEKTLDCLINFAAANHIAYRRSRSSIDYMNGKFINDYGNVIDCENNRTTRTFRTNPTEGLQNTRNIQYETTTETITW